MNKIIYILLITLCTSCAGTYYVTSEREHPVEVYYNGVDVYWGYQSGFYYYYGKPHYYPWWNYYNTCPPSHYNTTTHVIITRPVNRPTHRPNRPNRQPNINKIDYNRIFNVNPSTNIKPIINNKTSNKNNKNNRSANTTRKHRK